MDQTRPEDLRYRAAGLALAAGASVLLMLAVLGASAWIRAAGTGDVQVMRAVHRVAASTVALLVILLWSLAWRRRRLVGAATSALALMLALSAVGWMTGTTPPPSAAFFNQAGGLALTGLLAWIAARASRPHAPDDVLRATAIAFAVAQGAFGAAIAAYLRDPPVLVLILHAAAGLAAAALVAALRHPLALAGAFAAPAAGLAAALAPALAAAPAAHALSAGLLLAAATARRRGS